MRYYKIVITDPANGQVVTPPGFNPGLLGGATYTSFVNGQTLPGAWNIELDIPVIGQATPQGGGNLRVWGVSKAEIAQANNLAGKGIAIYGGMQKGLPLANPAQSGLLAQGYIFQSFGNWIETDMTLDLVIMPGSPASGSNPAGVGTLAKPANLVLNWKAGTPLAGALQSAIQTAFPGYTVKVNINAGIVRQNDEVGFFPTLEQLAQYARQTSRAIIKTQDYQGVDIVVGQNTIAVSDASAASNSSTQLQFQDLIGQPTWIEAPNIQIKAVMRADLAVGSAIKLPPTLITNTAQAAPSLVNQQVAFQGGFDIVSLRHVGNFRAPTADAWVTIIEAAPTQIAGNG